MGLLARQCSRGINSNYPLDTGHWLLDPDASGAPSSGCAIKANRPRFALSGGSDHRAHGPENGQHALEISLGLTDVLRPKVLEHDARRADLATYALREK